MDSNYTRANQVFVTFMWVLFTTVTLSHISTYVLFNPTPTATIAIEGLRDLTENKAFKSDQANLLIRFGADFTSEFNWNANQLYVFIVAEYETSKKGRNEVVLYDLIIRNVSEALIPESVMVNEYPLRDQFRNTLLGNKVILKVWYQRMPLYGLMNKVLLAESQPFTLPKEYVRK